MISKRTNFRVALVHDWLTGMRGGEKVLEAFCELFPRSDLFTLIHNPGSVSKLIESHRIFTSFANKLPFKSAKYRHYLPLFPTAIEQFNLKGYDLILSTSHCVAKGVITPPDAIHVSYLHTPMRYVWDMYQEYFGPDKVGFFTGKIIPFFANYLRMWDVSSSTRVDWFLANSEHVASRIKKYYGRNASVIHPPVDVDKFKACPDNDDYYLILSALVPYKKVDLAVAAFNKMKKRLVVVGNGPERKKLLRMSGANIKFVDWQPAEKLEQFYSGCKALVFPGEEDFGIVPVEAMACGKPVIAYGRGGALETVRPSGREPEKPGTGIFFYEQTVDNLIQAVVRSEEIKWDPEFISNYAKNFDTRRFKTRISNFLSEKIPELFHQKKNGS